ncbi:CagC family type IV secretion system protein [Clostridium sp. WILCCON 0269]|uniref:CagC family type IV secretion system protein n=1 Tax=Candidatus Clostridium eludens TaxID=3381663 RepID=A0ABW8SPS2_9CLOT
MKKISKYLASAYTTFLVLGNTVLVKAESNAGDIQQKLTTGFNTIQVVVTSVIAVVGVIAAAKIVISKLPSLDDPHMKNEMWRGIGMVGAAVATGGALTWLIPWVYGLFQ